MIVRSQWISAIAATAALALGLSACSAGPASNGDGSSATGGTLTIANGLDNNSFDPAALEIGNRIQYWMPVYDTLLVLDPESKPQANLATEWSYNDDNTVLNLTLRDGVTFTDGEPFNGEAVKANLEHLKGGGGQNAYMAASVESVDVVSDTEVNLNLSAPDPGLLNYLGVVGGAMASPASLTSPDLATTPVGSGPYALDKAATTPGSQYTYVRNEEYWNADEFPYDTVVVKPMTDLTARLNAIKSGQVNAAIADAKSIAEAEASRLTVSTTAVNWLGLFISDRDGAVVPALGDVRVRQALNYAFDRQAILDNVQLGNGELTNQVFGDTSEAFDEDLDDTYSYDLEKAKDLMSEAGYADGFTVQMPDTPGFATYTPLITQTLADLNITVDLVKVSPESLISEVLSGKFPMFFFTLGSQSAWQDIQKLALPTSPWNTSKVASAELDALVQAAQFASEDDRVQAFQDINAWFVDNAWFAPWYREYSIYLTDAKTDVVMQSQNVAPWIRNFSPAS
jgi:peptide/nickel transport system substrate-binding protein